MRRVTTFALVAGGALAAAGVAVFARGRLGGGARAASTTPDNDLQFTQFAPGGPQGS